MNLIAPPPWRARGARSRWSRSAPRPCSCLPCARARTRLARLGPWIALGLVGASSPRRRCCRHLSRLGAVPQRAGVGGSRDRRRRRHRCRASGAAGRDPARAARAASRRRRAPSSRRDQRRCRPRPTSSSTSRRSRGSSSRIAPRDDALTRRFPRCRAALGSRPTMPRLTDYAMKGDVVDPELVPRRDAPLDALQRLQRGYDAGSGGDRRVPAGDETSGGDRRAARRCGRCSAPATRSRAPISPRRSRCRTAPSGSSPIPARGCSSGTVTSKRALCLARLVAGGAAERAGGPGGRRSGPRTRSRAACSRRLGLIAARAACSRGRGRAGHPARPQPRRPGALRLLERARAPSREVGRWRELAGRSSRRLDRWVQVGLVVPPCSGPGTPPSGSVHLLTLP